MSQYEKIFLKILSGFSDKDISFKSKILSGKTGKKYNFKL